MMYSSCYPCKGICRSIIADFRKGKFHIIPNDLYDLLAIFEKKDYDDIFSSYDAEDQKTIKEYADFLLLNSISFWTTKQESKRFSKLSLEYVSPTVVSNAVIEVPEGIDPFICCVDQLVSLGCRFIQVRFTCLSDVSFVREIFSVINQSNLIGVEVVFYEKIVLDLLKDLVTNKIISVVIPNDNVNELVLDRINSCPVLYVDKPSFNSCGYVSPNYFVVNEAHFTEAINFNSCLHRKLFVGRTGDIKNCPGMSFSYGNIADMLLSDVVSDENFKKWGGIRKDSVEVCSNCEFRHICTDCRAFVKDPENIYSQPSQCTYNPYIAKWAGEDGYVPVEECGSYSRETGFVVDAIKVDALNQRVMA